MLKNAKPTGIPVWSISVLLASAMLMCAPALCLGYPSTFTFSIAVPSPGEWEVYGRLEGNTAGLAGFIINVTGTDGLAITSSVNKAPYFFELQGTTVLTHGYYFRIDGNNGIGVQGGQATGYPGGNDPAKDALIIQDVGILPGSAYSFLEPVSWSAPVLLASGTYSGLEGHLHARVGAGSITDLMKVNGGPWVGPSNVETTGAIVLADYYVPEPGVLALLLPALLLRARVKRPPARRRVG